MFYNIRPRSLYFHGCHSIFSDCWYFYALNPLDRFLSGRIDTEPDQTIEILMTELDPKVMETFTKSKAKNGHDATKVIKDSVILILKSKLL